MKNYTRVIPRDFFNEAKLLKCMGLLSLKILDRNLPNGLDIEIEDTGNPFNIQLTDCGSLYVCNYRVTINGYETRFATTYNSKANYPLYALIDDQEIRVFDESGDFEPEFIAAAMSEYAK